MIGAMSHFFSFLTDGDNSISHRDALSLMCLLLCLGIFTAYIISLFPMFSYNYVIPESLLILLMSFVVGARVQKSVEDRTIRKGISGGSK